MTNKKDETQQVMMSIPKQIIRRRILRTLSTLLCYFCIFATLYYCIPNIIRTIQNTLDVPGDFANGTIQSVAFPTYCLDTLGEQPLSNVGFFECARNRTMPHLNQMWNFNDRQEIKNSERDICLDMYSLPPNAIISLQTCTGKGGSQFWYYDKEHKLIVHKENGSQCIEVFQVEDIFHLEVNECDKNNKQMQWIFGYVNQWKTPSRQLSKSYKNDRNVA